MDAASMPWHALLSLFTRAVGSKASHRSHLDSLISLCLSVHFWFTPGPCVFFLGTPYRQSIPPAEVWQTSLFLKQHRPPWARFARPCGWRCQGKISSSSYFTRFWFQGGAGSHGHYDKFASLKFGRSGHSPVQTGRWGKSKRTHGNCPLTVTR